jgi:hypothetical protein
MVCPQNEEVTIEAAFWLGPARRIGRVNLHVGECWIDREVYVAYPSFVRLTIEPSSAGKTRTTNQETDQGS